MERREVEDRGDRGGRALVALGANLGDARKNLLEAVERMASRPEIEILATSSFIRTAPVGGPSGQPPFLNGAALIRTTASPFETLTILHEIEKSLGRERKVFWGARTIDLDLILYDDLVLSTPELTIPHPRLQWRHFVLDPACEIAPNAVVPTFDRTLAELRRALYWTFANFETATALRYLKESNGRI